MPPKVTVYIPTHNRKNLLLRAVQSVLDQTYDNIEVIVSDDGSTDGTFDALRSLVEEKKIKYFFSRIPKGACHARNMAINQATGTYITGLDDDDYFSPDRIQRFVASLSPKYQIYTSAYKVLREETSFDLDDAIGEISKKSILESNIIGNQIFTKTEYIKSVGGFDENLPAWQDYELWIRLIKKYGSCLKLSDITYIVDYSHPHERISKDLKKIDRAYDVLVNKHDEYKQRRFKLALRLSKLRYKKMSIADLLPFVFSHHFRRALTQYKRQNFPSYRPLDMLSRYFSI